MIITIETIPHGEQRYPTAGDWHFSGAGLAIRVSEMADWRHEMLVAVHELVEALLCKHRQIGGELVDAFDMQHDGIDEPGDDPACPYRREHFFATSVERLLCAELGVDWAEYDKAVGAL